VFINQDVERVSNIWQVKPNTLTAIRSIRPGAPVMAGLTILHRCDPGGENPVVQDRIGEITTYIELAAIVASKRRRCGNEQDALEPGSMASGPGNCWYPRVREIMQLARRRPHVPAASVGVSDGAISGT
jgi:hypothetical protein